MLSRRNFLLGSASAATLIACKSELASAAFHGSSALNASRVTQNIPTGAIYLNVAKGWNLPAQDPTTLSSDGYNINAPAFQNITGSMPYPSNYYDKYVWKWTGTASMSFSNPAIIYAGAQYVLNSGNVGGVGATGNSTLISANLGANPRVVLKFGALVTAVSGGSGSLVTITTGSLNFGSGLATGTNIKLGVGVSANLATGPNSDGSWTITNVSGTQFTLNGSTGVTSPTVTGTGGVGVQSEAVMGNFSDNPIVYPLGTFSGWGGLVFCKIADEADVDSGLLVDAVLISQLRDMMNPRNSAVADVWLRTMDLNGAHSSYECDFSQRIPSTNITYSSINTRPGYWTTSASGAISSSSAGVTYTCADPSVTVWNGSSYIDNAIVQGIPDVNSTGTIPTLNVGGHGAKPVFDFNATPFIVDVFAVAPSAGQSVVFTFSASWLSSHAVTYTTVTADTLSVSTLRANITTALMADTTLSTALIQFSNSGGIAVFPRTAQAGRLSLTYTSGPAIVRIGNLFANGVTGASVGTFIYNYLLDGWIYQVGGMTNSVPFEVFIEICNRVGANCWYNWGITKGAFVTATTGFFRDNLNAGLKFGVETANEVWNAAASPFPMYDSFGKSLGFLISSNQATYGYCALRTIQFQALGLAAWTTTRPASTFYTLQMSSTFDASVGGNFDLFQLKGPQLNASTNTIYATYGGLNGSGSAPSYNAYPNRPVDITTAIGMAPYWDSLWWTGEASPVVTSGITGTVVENAPWLQASLDYTNGLTSTAYTSLVNQFNGTTARSSGSISPNITLSAMQAIMTSQEAVAAAFDSGRGGLGLSALGIMHYEGGPTWAMGADYNNGVNSVNSTDITALANAMTTLGWNVNAYDALGGTGATAITHVATQVITMIQAWKFDATYKDMVKLNLYQALKNTSGAHREAKPCQFGYGGGQWAIYPSFYGAGNPYASRDAIREFNL